MAINATDVQGTKVYILDVPATPFADCSAAVTAIQAGAQALCPQSLGEFTRSRESTELGCMSSNETLKATGKMTYGDFTMELLFDMADTTGQKKLFDAMEANTPVIIGVESPFTSPNTSGDIIWTEAIMTGDGISYPDGSKVGYSVTLAPYGGFQRCPAA